MCIRDRLDAIQAIGDDGRGRRVQELIEPFLVGASSFGDVLFKISVRAQRSACELEFAVGAVDSPSVGDIPVEKGGDRRVGDGLGFDGLVNRGDGAHGAPLVCLLYTSPSPRDRTRS